jgi:hypothetical protein
MDYLNNDQIITQNSLKEVALLKFYTTNGDENQSRNCQTIIQNIHMQ